MTAAMHRLGTLSAQLPTTHSMHFVFTEAVVEMASLCASKSAFAGKAMAFTPARGVAPRVVPTSRVVRVEASKVCELTGKSRNKANKVCFSNKKYRFFQEPNLQRKKLFWEYGQRWVSLRLSTKAIKTVEKNGLDKMAQEAGIDLWKLPYEDARPERLAYLAENKGKVPVAVNPRCECCRAGDGLGRCNAPIGVAPTTSSTATWRRTSMGRLHVGPHGGGWATMHHATHAGQI